MPTYNLNKINFSQILSLVGSKNPVIKLYGYFDKNRSELLIYSLTRLSNHDLQISKEEVVEEVKNFKGRFSYCLAGADLKPKVLGSLIKLLETFKFKSGCRLTIEIREGKTTKNRLINKSRALEASSKTNTSGGNPLTSPADFLISQSKKVQKLSSKELIRLNEECFSVIVKAESETEEAYQFLSALRGEHNRVIKKGFWLAPRMLMTRGEIQKFLDFSDYKKIEVAEIKNGITIGTTRNQEPIQISKASLGENMRIEGLNNSGKSGTLINIAMRLNQDDDRILLLDPHNETGEKILNRVPKIENIEVLAVKHNGRFMGTNPLICFGSREERAEKSEQLKFAFFGDDIQEGRIATTDAGGEFLKTGIEFNFAFFNLLKKLGFSSEKVVEIMKEKQLTLNDLARITNDRNLQDLIAELLQESQPFIASKLKNFKKSYNSAGANGAVTRFRQVTDSTTGKAFFESRGFNPVALIKEGKSVFCLTNGLNPLNRGVINKLIFGELWFDYKARKIEGKTYFMVDEGASARVPNMLEITTEARKFGLHLITAYQGINMWKNPQDLEAVKKIPNLLEFDIDGNNKARREFIARTRDYPKEREPRGFTTDYPAEVRNYNLETRGYTYEELEQKIQLKEMNPRKYFLEDLNID